MDRRHFNRLAGLGWLGLQSRSHRWFDLLSDQNLIPHGACLLLSISGGQDSMALLQLILDLRRLHNWELNVWHGDHCWHDQSSKICQELKHWCHIQKLPFYYAKTNQEIISSEEKVEKTSNRYSLVWASLFLVNLKAFDKSFRVV